MYNQFYNFSEQPFNLTPDPKFLYLSPVFREALASIIYGINERKGFISIIGEVGTGKTTLLYTLLGNLNERVKPIFIFHTTVTFEQLLSNILLELKVPLAEEDKSSLLQKLNEYLLQKMLPDETLAIIIDEAQNLPIEVMEEFCMLCNMEASKLKLLQILLVGQPELEEKLNSENLRQLKQRIEIRCHLKPLSRKECKEYINYRLKLVGSSSSKVLNSDAISMILSYSRGIPRTINILCDNAFLIGYGLSKKKINGKIIREVIKDLKGYTPLISHQGSDPFLVEAYRTLLTNIQFCQPGKLLKTLLITSTGPQEGKSTIVANLGVLLAQGGSKVLLVDADLRAPTLCKLFNVTNYSGLSDLLIQVSSTQITRGSLEDFSVGDAFQLFKMQKKTGVLRVEKEETIVSLFFKDGEVIEVDWKNVPRTKGLGEIFRIKDGTFQFQETDFLNDQIDISANPSTEDTLQKTIPQIYRQPFIESRVTSFLRPTQIENLKLLTSGYLPPNPPQLLGSESMKTVVNMFRNKFDAVIFDSPPSGLVTDAAALASIVDGVILVVRKGFYDKRFIQRAKEGLERGNSNIYGVVLNQVDLKRDGYYYGGYGYGYVK